MTLVVATYPACLRNFAFGLGRPREVATCDGAEHPHEYEYESKCPMSTLPYKDRQAECHGTCQRGSEEVRCRFHMAFPNHLIVVDRYFTALFSFPLACQSSIRVPPAPTLESMQYVVHVV